MPTLLATNLALIDWIVLAICLLGLVAAGTFFRRYVKGVSDYVVAGRKMRKFLGLSTDTAFGLGLISIVGTCEQGFLRGFSFIWIGLVYMALPLVLYGVFGFAIMRFRDQKVMTLAEYFEKRFNKPTRILAGFVQAVSGILNLAIFPIAGSVFLVHFMGLPQSVTFFGWVVDPVILLMTVMIGLALFFTFIGGMVSVVLTDFIQSVVIAVALIAGTAVLLWQLGPQEIHQALQEDLGRAGYNPFAGSGNTYGFWFFAWLVIGIFGGIGFAPQLQRIASTDSAKTARQMYLLGMIFSKGRESLLLLWGIAALAALGALAPEGIDPKQWSQIAPAQYLGGAIPIVVKGLFLAGLIAAFISTVDSYLLTYGSVIANDLVCPLLRRPIGQRGHIWLLRGSVVGIALFLLLFGVVYTPQEEIMFYLMLTGTMFWGTGLAMVGGLYWKRSTAPAAFATIAAMCVLPPSDMICRRVFGDAYPITPSMAGVFSTLVGAALFVIISLLTPPPALEEPARV